METDSLYFSSLYPPSNCHSDRGFSLSMDTSPTHRIPTYSSHNLHHHKAYVKKEELEQERGDRGSFYNLCGSADNITKLSDFIHIQKHPNGGATIVYMDEEEYRDLSKHQIEQLADLFFKEVFREEPTGVASHVMGVVHNAAGYLPELVSYFEQTHANVTVKMGCLRNSEIETTNFAGFAKEVRKSYCNGTFRCGPLLQVSCVGQVAEEAGRYFPDFLGETSSLECSFVDDVF